MYTGPLILSNSAAYDKIYLGITLRLAVLPFELIFEGVITFLPLLLEGGDRVEYIALILIIVLYTIVEIKK